MTGHAMRRSALLGAVAILLTAAAGGCARPRATHWTLPPEWSLVHGGVVRGDSTQPRIALVFTGGDHGEGTPHILDALADRDVTASFFVTGGYLANPDHAGYVRTMVRAGHYVGPHSHAHLLYCPWENRDESLVTEREFKEDLRANIAALRGQGVRFGEPIYFIPPFEWYNRQHAEWAQQAGCLLFNYTPGSGSHRDWAPEGHKAFRPSRQIVEDILAHERREPDGLNGHILLLHLGSLRQDKMHRLLGELIDALHQCGYHFRRIDELLAIDPASLSAADSPVDVRAGVSVQWGGSFVK